MISSGQLMAERCIEARVRQWFEIFTILLSYTHLSTNGFNICILLREEKGKDKNNTKELIRTEKYKTVNCRDSKRKKKNPKNNPLKTGL